MSYGRDPMSGGVSPVESHPPEPDPDAIEVGMNVWAARRLMQLYPDVEPKVRGTVRGLVGNEFSDKDLTEIEDRAIKAAKVDDLHALAGLNNGVPVFLNPKQEGVVERIVSGLGSDDVGRRAQGAYRRARTEGRIRRAR